MSEKIVQLNEEVIKTCKKKSSVKFKNFRAEKMPHQTKPLCISK